MTWAGHRSPLERPDERLTTYDDGAGRSAWRVTETEAYGLSALVYMLTGMSISIPSSPDTDRLVFALFDDDGGDQVAAIELAGRADLNSLYECHVGYTPDREPAGV